MEIASVSTTRLHYQHKVIVDLIDGLSDRLIRERPAPEKWSIFETMVHLQIFQHVFMNRLEAIQTRDRPVFELYRAEQDPAFTNGCTRPTLEIVQGLLAYRKEMASRIPQITPAGLQRVGVHASYGPMNIPEWVNFFLLHEAHHLFVMFRQSAALRNQLNDGR